MDYTGVEQDSPCFKCTDTDVKNCMCKLDFSIDSLLKVATVLFVHFHTQTLFAKLSS